MFYRIRIDMAFTEEDAVRDIEDKTLDHLANAVVINPGHTNQEIGYIRLEKCYHDEQPPKPCELIAEHQTPVPEITSEIA